MASIALYPTYTDGGVELGVGVSGLDAEHKYDRTVIFALYHQNNHTALETNDEKIIIKPGKSETGCIHTFETILNYNTYYVVGCTIETNGESFDIPYIDNIVYHESDNPDPDPDPGDGPYTESIEHCDESTQYVTWSISGLTSISGNKTIYWYVDDDMLFETYIDEYTDNTTELIYMENYQGSNVVLKVEIFDEDGNSYTITEESVVPILGQKWNIGRYGLMTPDSDTSIEKFMESCMMHLWSIVFTESGEATFYTTGDLDTVGYLSDSPEEGAGNASPANPIASDDNSGDGFNFSMSYYVTAGVTYYLWVRPRDYEAYGDTTIHITVPNSGTKVEPWVWPDGYEDLLTGNGSTRDFHHSVWNNLAYKVSEARLASNYEEWNDYYATYDKTCMSDDTEESRKLTAVRYNSLKYNIGEIYKTDILDVSPGQVVEGQKHFLNLAKKLNDWIDKINKGEF